jgi:sugar/nucleoside kinase (ribokinase family)
LGYGYPESVMSERRSIPTAVGTGFIVLDVVMNAMHAQPPRFWAGGTCGNVLAILGFLGWKSSAIARLSDDAAGAYVLDDLKRWHVDVHLAQVQPRCPTPVLIQEIAKAKSGAPVHRFLWVCPGCGAYFPTFRPVTIKAVEEILPTLEKSSVFFFDRVSPGILVLVRHYADTGSLIVFEPSGTNDPKLFREALKYTHVLKYSQQRAHSFSDLLGKASPLLQIETLGEDGLRYKCNLTEDRNWRRLEGFDVSSLKDTSGSGDWCTAGIVSKIGAHGSRALHTLGEDDVLEALRYGQALAAWNCSFEGARGGMYTVSKDDFKKAISQIIRGQSRTHSSNTTLTDAQETLAIFCPNCDASPATPRGHDHDDQVRRHYEGPSSHFRSSSSGLRN